MEGCRFAKRPQAEGTWISDEIEKAYNELFEKGFAHSAEAWQNNELAGGLYGVLIGKVFFGESMFANKSNASKFAFIKLVQALQKNGIAIIPGILKDIKEIAEYVYDRYSMLNELWDMSEKCRDFELPSENDAKSWLDSVCVSDAKRPFPGRQENQT